MFLCLVLWRFITRVDPCHHHQSQEELFLHDEKVPHAAPLLSYPFPFPHSPLSPLIWSLLCTNSGSEHTLGTDQARSALREVGWLPEVTQQYIQSGWHLLPQPRP